MQTILLNREKVAVRARKLYDEEIRHKVENDENVGKMVIIDIETGNYRVDPTGLESAKDLRKKNLNTCLFGIRIGYKTTVSFGGVLERDRMVK